MNLEVGQGSPFAINFWKYIISRCYHIPPVTSWGGQTTSHLATMVLWVKHIWVVELRERYMSTSGWLTWGSEDGAWFLYLNDFRTKSSLPGEGLSYLPVTLWGEPQVTLLVVWTFSQVVIACLPHKCKVVGLIPTVAILVTN